MSQTRTYPHGVPSWVDTEQSDAQAAQGFYQRLFGWAFRTASPPGGSLYAIASLGGRDVAGLGAAQTEPVAWNTYIAVNDADAAAARVSAAGGEIVAYPSEVARAGRMAICRERAGAEFRIWQAHQAPGAHVVNEPGSWNFSDLHTDRPDTVGFYTEVFGWSVEDLGFATMLRSPGYGDHLEAQVDPDIRVRQQGVDAPPGFEDAIARVGALEPDTDPHWHVTFAVEDRDATAATARRLGAEIISTADSLWTRTVLLRDPQGAIFSASQFTPPA